jgi:hypothetical protein
MKERITRTYVPLYDISLRLIVTTSVDESAEIRGFTRGDYEAVTIRYKGKLYIVVTKNATPGTIAHEAIHAAAEILHKVGVKFGFSNQEPLSYLSGWITDWVVKKI